MSERKPRRNISEQIEDLKNKGVKFNIINEKSAMDFLTKNSYLFKVKAYRKNYEKDSDGRYINLEFAYLVDLSTIDMHIRRFALRLTLDIEHALKTKLLADFNQCSNDGYDIVENFLQDEKGAEAKKHIKNKVEEAKNGENYSPILPILRNYKQLPIWVFMEVVQFGHLINFCKYFYSQRGYADTLFDNIKSYLFSAKCLRNACAHNNCILLFDNKTCKGQMSTYHFLFNNKINIEYNIQGELRNRTINDFVTSLILFDKVCLSMNLKHHYYKELKELFEGRLLKHKEYYADNKLLADTYHFVFNVVCFFQRKNSIAI
ncbi:MAG: Abi family protein [Campylobacteraceae bacterium]|jgi:abortive infection bacteriophage resistance protein|nr:Abi family protein [Campylobacteraceae bacterium]